MPKRSVESWNTGLLHRRNIGCSLKSQNRKSSPLPGAKRASIGKNYRRTVRLSDLPLPDGSRTLARLHRIDLRLAGVDHHLDARLRMRRHEIGEHGRSGRLDPVVHDAETDRAG